MLAIGERLPDLAARCRAARIWLDEAMATYDRLNPDVPLEIVAPTQVHLVEIERGLDREPIVHERDGRGFRRFLYSSRNLKIHILEIEAPRNTKEGRRLRRIARLAAKYEKDREAAIGASGYREPGLALTHLHIELQDDFAGAARAVKPLTMQGVAIYAAIVAFGSVPARRQDGTPACGCDALALVMAEAFVAINGGGAT